MKTGRGQATRIAPGSGWPTAGQLRVWNGGLLVRDDSEPLEQLFHDSRDRVVTGRPFALHAECGNREQAG